jgi:3-polyprenyl-4-hydroxybenzoate decarboxylase
MRILVAITGASGLEYGRRLVELLRKQSDCDVSVVISSGAREVAKKEGALMRLPEADYE